MKKNKKNTKKNYWILKIMILSFIISIIFTIISELAIPNVNILFGIILIIVFVFIGILFDMIGVAVTTSDESVFHSMASKKVRGAKLAIKFKKNADKVANLCQDVVGDICGIISGSTGAVISLKIVEKLNIPNLIVILIVMGMISTLTIGGKAMVKGVAIKKANNIVYRFAYLISFCIKG